MLAGPSLPTIADIPRFPNSAIQVYLSAVMVAGGKLRVDFTNTHSSPAIIDRGRDSNPANRSGVDSIGLHRYRRLLSEV